MSDNVARPAGGPLGEVGLKVVAELEVIKAAPDDPGSNTEEVDQ